MQPIRPFSITAPGFAGLNTQDSPVDMDTKYALEANNCVIDKFGRVGARKGWTPVTAASGTLGSSNIESLGELISLAGGRTVIAAGANKIFKIVGSTLTELTYGGGGVAPVITTNNWQMCCHNDAVVLFQRGYDPLIYDIVLSTTQYRRLSEHPTYSGTAPLANCGISAYGRVWAANTVADKSTVTWSDTGSHQRWTGGTSGSLNLLNVWPNGGDEIVALAAHNNTLVIFGTRQTLIYTGASTPSTMVLSDAISNCGCVGRDTVQNTPDDLIFLSDGGVRSIRRVIQEKSAPLTLVSRAVNDDVLAYVNAETSGDTIKSVYSPIDSFYLLTFVQSMITYCFDMRSAMPDGSSRVTTWTSIEPKCYYYSPSRVLYIGKPGYVGSYGGYADNTSEYRVKYFTSWIDFGDPVRTSILKKIIMTIFGGINQVVTYKWGFDYVSTVDSENITIGAGTTPAEYGTAEFGIAEYSTGLIVSSLSSNAGGVGKVIQIGFECQITGAAISIQRVDVYTKDGAYK